MKHFKKVFVLVLAIFCFAGLTLTGCSSNNTKTVTVIAYIEGVETERKNIDIFNNAILTPPSEDKIPAGKVFYGWSTSENWDETSKDFVVEGNFISYNNVKEHAVNGEVKLYPAYKVKVEKYFVFGVWKYSKSGVDDSTISTIESGLKSFLKTDGATDEQLARVEMRIYTDSTVGSWGAKVNKDGDVDVFLGSGENITSNAGVETITKKELTINGKGGRYFSLLNNEDLSVKVYNWFQTYALEAGICSEYIPSEYVRPSYNVTFSLGEHASSTAVVPTEITIYGGSKFILPEAPEAEEGYTFAGWKVGESTTLMAAGAEVTVTANLQIIAQYKSAGAVTVTYSNGLKTRTASTTAPESDVVAPGTEITLPAAPTAKPGFVFAGWRVGTELKAAGSKVTLSETTAITAEYTVDSTVSATIIVGYYAKSGTSGVTEDIATSVETALKAYLESIGITDFTNLEIKGYGKPNKNVADTVTEINNDIDAGENVGVFFGFKAYGKLNVDPNNIEEGFVINGVEGRRVLKLAENAISNIIFDWMVAENSTFLDAIK